MKEMFSKEKDCNVLARKLKAQLNDKINFYCLGQCPNGKYLSIYRRNNGENMLNGKYLPFYFKFSENEFLRIGVGSSNACTSLGEKLAALSDFYTVLNEEYGEPTVFYTVKDDDEKQLSLQWSFINKDEEIARFKENTYFDDAQIDTLIVIGEKGKNTNEFHLSDTTNKLISKRIGLPLDLLYLVDEDIDNFIKHKIGKQLTIPAEAKIDGIPVTSFDKKLEKKLKHL